MAIDQTLADVLDKMITTPTLTILGLQTLEERISALGKIALYM